VRGDAVVLRVAGTVDDVGYRINSPTRLVDFTKKDYEDNYSRGLNSSTFQLNLSRVGHTSPCS